MKHKLQDMFSPSRNWKTTLTLVSIVAFFTITLSLFMGFRYSNDLGTTQTFFLIAKYENSFSYIRYIFESENSGANTFANTTINQSAQLFSTTADYLLISLIGQFVITISFVINHFRLINIVTKVRRVLNSSIVLVSSLALLLIVILYWIAYFQTIPILGNKSWQGTQTWFPTWQTIFQLTLFLVGAAMIVAMASYNMFVETRTIYISISQKQELENKSKQQEKSKPDNILSE